MAANRFEGCFWSHENVLELVATVAQHYAYTETIGCTKKNHFKMVNFMLYELYPKQTLQKKNGIF